MKKYLVASTSARPGWDVYTITESQPHPAGHKVRVLYPSGGWGGGAGLTPGRDGTILIPKSTIKIHTATREDAERAARMLDTIDRQHGEALAAADNLRRTATALLVEQYE